MENETLLNKFWLKYFLPIPTIVPVLYVQGVAYYQGTLSPYNIPYNSYPLSFEDALLQAFFFYLKTPEYFLYITLALLVLFVPLCYLGQAAERKLTSSNSVSKWLAKYGVNITKHFVKFKEIYTIPLITLLLAYVIYALSIIVVIPYLYAKHESSKNAVEAYNSINSPKIEAVLYKDNAIISIVENGKINDFEGKIIMQSNKAITFIVNDSIMTFPINHVFSVKYILDKNKEKK